MTVKIDGTNTEANPAFTGADTDTGLQCGTNELKLVTGGTARATVDSSGRVLVGTASGTAKVEAVDSSFHQFYARGSGNVGGVRFGNTTKTNGYIYYDNGGNMNFHANGAERIRIQAAGGISFNGDTAAANALDDYEEGTWTPAFWAGDENINVAYADQAGLYTKIGNIVHIYFRLFTSSRTAGSGALYVDGLPFTPTGDRCVLSISPAFSNWGSNNAPYGGFTSTNGRILLKKVDNSDARALRDTNIDTSIIATAGLIGSMTYKIT